MTGKKKTLRVYFIQHGDGRLTGILLRASSAFFDVPPPSAYGASEDEVLHQLEIELRERALGDESLSRYLWDESFEVQKVRVNVHPQSLIKKRPVIGKRSIPLQLTYIWSKMGEGAYRVMLPRFGWWFILEDLEMAVDALKNAVSGALLGEHPRWLYDFRHEGEEYVKEWEPRLTIRPDKDNANRDDEDSFPTLKAVADEWVEAAARGKLPFSISHGELGRRERELVSRYPPPSLLLVGEPGVGKTVWVRRLAEHFARERGPRKLGTPRLWRTSGDRILAGMIYLGQWQKRALELVRELRHEGDYLYVDRLTSILKPRSDGASIAELFLPALAASEISVIAECSETEYESARQGFPAFLATFQVIRLEPTSPAETAQFLEAYLARRAPNVRFHPLALRRLIQYLDHFEPQMAFPGKIFRFVDGLTTREGLDRPRHILARDVTRAYAQHSGLPVEVLDEDARVGATGIADALKKRVAGQDEACETAARVVARFKAGLADTEKPVGSLFFVGPTGVGKTELAKQMARYLYGDASRIVRVDMSEYAAPGSFTRLFQMESGATSLASQVRRQPLSLVLFDEIEKAHPEVFDLLLGVLGEGRLSDPLGQLVDFRMTLIVMTSNLGTSATSPVGFRDGTVDPQVGEVRKYFRPEFFNRLDYVIAFQPLDPESLLRVVDIELEKAAARPGLVKRQLKLRVAPEAKALLARVGYHPARGARPLKRAVEERLMAPLATLLVERPTLRSADVWVVCEGSPGHMRLTDADRRTAIVLRDSPTR